MAQMAHQAGTYSGFCSMKRLGIILLPSKRGTVRVKCLSQEHNIMFPARARAQAAPSGIKHTNHEATTRQKCGLSRSTLNNLQIKNLRVLLLIISTKSRHPLGYPYCVLYESFHIVVQCNNGAYVMHAIDK